MPAVALLLLTLAATPPGQSPLLHSARSGAWSSPSTWEGGQLPAPGARVEIRPGHVVTYDQNPGVPIRFLHVAGTLTFSRDRNTRLDVGILKIQPGEEATEDGAECGQHVHVAPEQPLAALEVGSPDAPIPSQHTATIRLVPFEGQDPSDAPSILSCGGRMDFHGAPLSRSWLKLGAAAKKGDKQVQLEEPVTGWRKGDLLIVTTTAFVGFFKERTDGGRTIPSVLDDSQTEEVHIAAIHDSTVVLDRPLRFDHLVDGRYRGEVADLSRNVVVESAQPDGVRGHTMYHHGSAGSIAYAEFRHLGKKGVLARYPVHFHKVRDGMRGSSVVGASIWDSDNRFLTIHGTDYLVVRDTVGYRSVGHGFFFEDGSEELNMLDRNLAVQAELSDPLPGQALAGNLNDGAGFWWANSLNSFTRNVAVECSTYGYRFQPGKPSEAPVEFEVRQSDGSMKRTDVRTLPFLRFEANEAHSQRRFAFNLGGFNGLADDRDLDRDENVLDRGKFLAGDVGGVGPDDRHPFVIKDFLAWRSHWGFHAGSPNVHFDGLDLSDVVYGIWRSNFAGHEYNHLTLRNVDTSSFFFGFGSDAGNYDRLRYLHLEDTRPPATVITGVRRRSPTEVMVTGVAADDAGVRAVHVNGIAATLGKGPLTEFQALVPAGAGPILLTAFAEDTSGNREQTPQTLRASGAHLEELRSVALAPAPPAVPATPASNPAVASADWIAAQARVLTSPSRWPLWDGREPVAAYAHRVNLPTSRVVDLGGEKLELELVPAGRFVMGSPRGEPGREADEGPPRAVLISEPFYLGRTEVTQGQYAAVMRQNPSYFRGRNLPVEQVSWNDAEAFVSKAGHGLTLPTEAQWELAARAGSSTPYPSGSGLADLARVSCYGGGEYQDAVVSHSCAVGSKAPNAFGLHDMNGNVYEWCADFYSAAAYSDGAAVDPRGPASGNERVLRGGSWESSAATARSANRNGYPPVSKGYTVGFRVAMPVGGQATAAN